MKKKILGIGLLVVVVGALVFGAVKVTMAAFEGEETTTEERGGNGNSYENPGDGYGVADSAGNGVSAADGTGLLHDVETTPLALIPAGELNQAETDALLFMWEEEKLARDVYTAFSSIYTKPLFNNIAASEQTHMDTVKELLDRYGLATPSDGTAGVFINTDLQALYTQLVAQGKLSELDAVKAGAAIEEIDILDLQERLAQTDQADIQQVFNSLLSGSYNHLNAFAANYWTISGTTYVPQYMSQADYDAVVTSTTFGSQGTGRGQGGGRH
jgi:hypothetical protein